MRTEREKDHRSRIGAAGRWFAQAAPGLVALAAIGLALWEGFENRQHNRMSVVPKLDGARDFDMTAQSFELALLSNGLGPAVVTDLVLFVDGEPVHEGSSDAEYPWLTAFRVFDSGSFDVMDSYYSAGQFLIPGERYHLFSVRRMKSAPKMEGFRDAANRIDAVVCYCSVYDDQCDAHHFGLAEVDTRAVCGLPKR